MSTPDAVATDAPAAKKPRGGKKRLLMMGVPVLLLAGGGAYAWQAGLLPFAPKSAGAAPAKNVPKLNVEPDSDSAHPRYKTSYLKLDGAFTTNLADSPRFVQLEIGVATKYEPVVLDHVTANEIPVRSAVLAVLAQQTEASITSPQGRAVLQRQLAVAVNHVLEEKEGFGGVSDVYVTGLVIQ